VYFSPEFELNRGLLNGLKIEKDEGGEPIVRGGVELSSEVLLVPFEGFVVESEQARRKGFVEDLSPPLVLRGRVLNAGEASLERSRRGPSEAPREDDRVERGAVVGIGIPVVLAFTVVVVVAAAVVDVDRGGGCELQPSLKREDGE
jgi:hypothetical protein